LAKDLLAQARHLAVVDLGKPKQANLRRAVSAAYHALFHMLVDPAASLVGSKLNAAGRAKLRRALAHADMKTVCIAYAKATTAAGFHPQIAPLVSFPVAIELRNVASAFVALQEARHLADYDVASKWDRLGVLQLVTDAEDAFADWQKTLTAPNSKIFPFDLLLRKSWART